jgi:hypothetical protein
MGKNDFEMDDKDINNIIEESFVGNGAKMMMIFLNLGRGKLEWLYE